MLLAGAVAAPAGLLLLGALALWLSARPGWSPLVLTPGQFARLALAAALLGWTALWRTATGAGLDWQGWQAAPALQLAIHLDGVSWSCGMLALLLALLWPDPLEDGWRAERRAAGGAEGQPAGGVEGRVWAARLAWVAAILALALSASLPAVYLAWEAAGALGAAAGGPGQSPAGLLAAARRADRLCGLGLLGAVVVMISLGGTTDTQALLVAAVSSLAVAGLLVAALGRAGWWPLDTWRGRLQARDGTTSQDSAPWLGLAWWHASGALAAVALLLRALEWAGGGWLQPWVPVALTGLGLVMLGRAALSLAASPQPAVAAVAALGGSCGVVLIGLAQPAPAGPLAALMALTSMLLSASTLARSSSVPAGAIGRACAALGWSGVLLLPGSLAAGAVWLAADQGASLSGGVLALGLAGAGLAACWAAGWRWLRTSAGLGGGGPAWVLTVAALLLALGGIWPAAWLAAVWSPALGALGGGRHISVMGLLGLAGLRGEAGNWPALTLALLAGLPLLLWVTLRARLPELAVADGETARPWPVAWVRATAWWLGFPRWELTAAVLRRLAAVTQEFDARGGWFTVVTASAVAALLLALR